MSNTLKGTITHIFETEFVGQNQTAKRGFVVDIRGGRNEEYDTPSPLQMWGDNCDRLNRHAVGEVVTVHYELRGNHWKDDKYFLNLTAWKIESNTASPQQSQPAPSNSLVDNDPLRPANDEEAKNDLPF